MFNAIKFVQAGSVSRPSDAGFKVRSDGGLSLVSGNESIRQALTLLLATTPGERVMRPQYGSDLSSLVFAANDETTAGLAIHYVRQAVEKWEPRIEVLAVDAGTEADQPGNMLFIYLDYRVIASRHVDRIEFTVDLGGATT